MTTQAPTKPEIHPSIKQYQQALKDMDYYKVFSANSKDAQLVNLAAWEEKTSLSWALDDFFTYCHDSKLPVPTEDIEPMILCRKLTSVLGKRFSPLGGKVITLEGTRNKYANVYKQFKPKHEPLPLDDTFHAFFKVFIKNDAERHILFQYIAHMVQHPEERPSWHIMLPSDTGVGKGFFFNDILRPLIPNNYLVKKFSELMKQFAPMLETGILVWLDDCKVKSYDTSVELKSILTEESQLTESKYGAAKMVDCYCRMILASNERIPLFVDISERRWCIFERLTYCNGLDPIAGKKHRIKHYIRPLSNWLEKDGAIEAVYNFFATYSLEGFDHKDVPCTESFLALVEDSKRLEHTMLEEWIEGFPEHCTWFKFSEAQDIFSNSKTACPQPQLLKDILSDCGYRAKRFQGAHKEMGTLWFPSSWSDAEMIKNYKPPTF